MFGTASVHLICIGIQQVQLSMIHSCTSTIICHAFKRNSGEVMVTHAQCGTSMYLSVLLSNNIALYTVYSIENGFYPE